MISEAFVLKLIGFRISSKFSFSPYLILMSGVTDDVAQVSITSVSGTNSLHPHFGHFEIFGLSTKGFTGKSSTFAKIGSPQSLQYQTGKGTPKYLCLEIHQSHKTFSTQTLYLLCMCSGCHLMSFPILMKSALWFIMSINHCFITAYSTSLPHLSCVWTSCSRSSILTTNPPAWRSSMICFLASLIFMPP